MKFNVQLKNYRTNSGLTQAQFAERTGFSRTTISELENEIKKPTLKTLRKLAENTNTDLNFWLDEKSDDTDIKMFDGLQMVIDKLIEVGDINNEGEINDSGKSLLMKMLEKEISLYVKCKKY